MIGALRAPGPYRLALLVLLGVASFYVLSLQLIWYYDHPVALPIYYLTFAALLIAATWTYCVPPTRSRLWIVATVAVLIGTIPYEMKLPFVAALFGSGNLDPENLSDATRTWPTPLRAIFEVALYPFIHFLLQYAIAMVVRREPARSIDQ